MATPPLGRPRPRFTTGFVADSVDSAAFCADFRLKGASLGLF